MPTHHHIDISKVRNGHQFDRHSYTIGNGECTYDTKMELVKLRVKRRPSPS